MVRDTEKFNATFLNFVYENKCTDFEGLLVWVLQPMYDQSVKLRTTKQVLHHSISKGVFYMYKKIAVQPQWETSQKTALS